LDGSRETSLGDALKIDIGADGKILGTKRVSANGQISGFTEYAGAEVLVILPGGSVPVVRRDAKDVLEDLEKLVEARMQLAFQEYKSLRGRFSSPRQAAKQFVKSLPTPNIKGVVQRADAWLREQADEVTEKVQERLRKPRAGAEKRSDNK
jgi:hypothetical protein